MSEDLITGVSLFSGAGGMDVGFSEAGIKVLFANELDVDAANTYSQNLDGSVMHVGDILSFMGELSHFKGADVVFGGPPCQGFSVAGKMNPADDRSKLIWTFLDVVELIQPRLFIMENVKALGTLPRWANVRERLLERAEKLGYHTASLVLQASDYGVPQNRERYFFFGFSGDFTGDLKNLLEIQLKELTSAPVTVRDAFSSIDKCTLLYEDDRSIAAIHLAKHPVLRPSPYRGSLLFNGRGRPLQLDSVAKTLPAQMGGNHTPIIDEALLKNPDGFDWIASYHQKLMEGSITPDVAEEDIPTSLRRISVREAAILQSFPTDYRFTGKRNKKYRQIGNAVPCKLAYAVATSALSVLDIVSNEVSE